MLKGNVCALFGGFWRRLSSIGAKAQTILHGIERPSFDFRVDAAEIFTQHTERQKLHASHEQNSHKQGRPAAAQTQIVQAKYANDHSHKDSNDRQPDSDQARKRGKPQRQD